LRLRQRQDHPVAGAVSVGRPRSPTSRDRARPLTERDFTKSTWPARQSRHFTALLVQFSRWLIWWKVSPSARSSIIHVVERSARTPPVNGTPRQPRHQRLAVITLTPRSLAAASTEPSARLKRLLDQHSSHPVKVLLETPARPRDDAFRSGGSEPVQPHAVVRAAPILSAGTGPPSRPQSRWISTMPRAGESVCTAAQGPLCSPQRAAKKWPGADRATSATSDRLQHDD
jgi:hypothetical protein